VEGSKQSVLSRQVSDHCALVIKNNIIDWGSKPFRTFDVWQQDVGFKEVVKNAWEPTICTDSSMEHLKEKLKRLKMEIKRWNKDVFSNSKHVRQKLIVEIDQLDKRDDEGTLQESEKVLRVDLLSQLRNMDDREIAMTKQKARVEWLSSGDTNSNFFHSRLRWQRAKNGLASLTINGVWCEDPITVKSQVKNFFENRFEYNPMPKLNLDGVSFKNIFGADNEVLYNSIYATEILEAVSSVAV